MEKKRGAFSNKMGFVLAAAGSAVGLGNLCASRTLQQNTEAAFSYSSI